MSRDFQITPDISVKAKVTFLPERSDPNALRWFFLYTILIENQGESSMQLIDRHWEILSGETNDLEVVDGPGVVGEQPWLEPGSSFQYTSAAILQSSFGSMKGHYDLQDELGKWFRAPIDPFILSMPSKTVH